MTVPVRLGPPGVCRGRKAERGQHLLDHGGHLITDSPSLGMPRYNHPVSEREGLQDLAAILARLRGGTIARNDWW